MAAMAFNQQYGDQGALKQHNGKRTEGLPWIFLPERRLGEANFTAFGQSSLVQRPAAQCLRVRYAVTGGGGDGRSR